MANILTVMRIWRSSDGNNWYLVPPEEVPDFLKEPEAVAKLKEGLGAQEPGSEVWYIGEVVDQARQRNTPIKLLGK